MSDEPKEKLTPPLGEETIISPSDEAHEEDLTTPAFEDSLVGNEENFLKERTHLKDDNLVERKVKNKNTLNVVKWVVALLLLMGIMALVFWAMRPTNSPQVVESKRPATTAVSSATATYDETKPLLQIFPDAPEVKIGMDTVTVNSDNISTTSNHKITISNSKLTPSSSTLSVTQPTDFTLASRGTNDNLSYDVYYFKDAAHSRLFQNIKDFNKVDVEGASAAGKFTLDLGDSKPPALAIINGDSTGWMIVWNPNDKDKVDGLIKNIKVS